MRAMLRISSLLCAAGRMQSMRGVGSVRSRAPLQHICPALGRSALSRLAVGRPLLSHCRLSPPTPSFNSTGEGKRMTEEGRLIAHRARRWVRRRDRTEPPFCSTTAATITRRRGQRRTMAGGTYHQLVVRCRCLWSPMKRLKVQQDSAESRAPNCALRRWPASCS